ncbi:glycosyltransferase [Marinobacter pelagius]|uniref:Glycosyltransferase involved in cell wall bisynthesis n=1 Tax=Marinobacter pelagius TaxID=379482 RepID=A0A1I4U0U9_9GAMM|nr:glycosyltransferase [Marinobacter pelagius]SFM82636.1 Glycosyltransferase involved in cell wall bisynthesis [Marinobacter pelagius]
MRILHFISSPAAGGAETYVRDLSILMRRKGHDVHIVFLQTAAESGRDPEFEKDFLSSLASASISYSFIGKEARRKPWLGGLRLRRFVRAFNADVVHCHLYYALLFSFFVFGVPVIYTHHNIRLGLPRIFYKIFDIKVSAYVAICAACKELLGSRRRSVLQINNAVSKSRILLKQKKSTNTNSEVTCVFVGSLCAQKNLTMMLRAFGLAHSSNVRLLVVGEGPDRGLLKELASSLGIDHRVEFLGNRSNINEILAESEIFLMSSAWEGLPIALIEATLAGLPVIVTNVGGCAEVVHQCANGFVVDSLEAGDYASALSKMVGDAELRASFSRNGLAFASVYEIERSVGRHLELYEEVISDGFSRV